MTSRIMHVFLHTTWVPNAHRGQKNVSETLELELYIAASFHVCAGIEPVSSGRAASAPSNCPISLALRNTFFF